jgi:hypothetical protein
VEQVSREINGHGAPMDQQLADAARRAKENAWKGERPHSQLSPAGQVAPAGGAARTEFFSRLRQPKSVTGWGKAAS